MENSFATIACKFFEVFTGTYGRYVPTNFNLILLGNNIYSSTYVSKNGIMYRTVNSILTSLSFPKRSKDKTSTVPYRTVLVRYHTE